MIACSGTVTLEAGRRRAWSGDLSFIAGQPDICEMVLQAATPVLPDIIWVSFLSLFAAAASGCKNITTLTEQALGDIEKRNKEGKKMSEQLKSVLSPDGKRFSERLKTALRTLS